MRRLAIVAMGGGAAATAGLVLVLVLGARPGAPPAAARPVTAASGGDLDAMLAAGRRARYAAPVPDVDRRRALADALARGSLDERRRALSALALADRVAADESARGLLADRALFADAARVLLLRPDGEPASADVARVRRALRTGDHDDASRRAVASLVLDTLVQHRSPAAARFAAANRR